MSSEAPDLKEVVELVIDRIVTGGDGFTRLSGMPIFVPRTAPGDRVRVRVTERRKDYARGEVVEVLDPGPGRVEPECPHYAACGGCDLQHLTYEAQVESKSVATLETLQRLGGVKVPDRLTVDAAEPWGYRRRAQWHLEDGSRVGYRERGGKELVEIERCPVLVPEIEAFLPEVRRQLEDGAAGERPVRLDVSAGDDGELSTAPRIEGLPHGELTSRVDGCEFRFDARCFFQGHRGLLGRLVERVLDDGDPDPERRLAVDLYAGVGLFALPLAKRFERVIAVDDDRVAIRYARRNAQRNRLPNVDAVARAVQTWVRELPDGIDRLVVDPTRRGLQKPVRQAIRRRLPTRITYVSCHAATMARDLKALAEEYSVESLALLDLFPQTGHMEVVAQLRRKAG